MIESIINHSLKHRSLVLLLSIALTLWGISSILKTPLDAIPDLSDVQVIVKSSYPGQSPQVIEDQVTYPLTSTFLAVPGAKVVRGYSFFGDSYVYVIFEDGTDIYWARSRVLEYLNQAKLPDGVKPQLGPDASGVGWVYEYALVSPDKSKDLAQLKTLHDWFIKPELQTVQGVSEVATIGGMVKQYQVVVDPIKLRQFNIPLSKVSQAIKSASQEQGASVLEMAGAEYMIRFRAYVQGIKDLAEVPVGILNDGLTPILLKDIANIKIGPQMRRGIAELNGEGEVVGGIVIMRSGENALSVIKKIKQKISSLELPDGVEFIETYNRSGLIERSIQTLTEKLIEEMIVVALVSLLFLWHLRSALVAIVALPLGILGAFIVMEKMGITANIMSLGGIAIAIGAMVDAAIVMIENAHKLLEKRRESLGTLTNKQHWQTIADAAIQVGPALFFSLMVITLSFIPVLALEAQEGRLFAPLAYTKTLAMAMAAGLSITLVPVLMGYFIRGKIPNENKNPLNRFLVWLYRPFLHFCLRFPFLAIFLMLISLTTILYPWKNLGTEFMPDMDEGDLLYMPTTLPGISIGEAQSLLQQTDRLIHTIPEVVNVFGKIGRAETATDPAPLTMIETSITLKPKDEWREGLTLQGLIKELDTLVKFPGVTNGWVQPIKTRIDMLSTGIKTPLGVKVSGDDLSSIQVSTEAIESLLNKLPNTSSAIAERVEGGKYIDIVPNRITAARYGFSMLALKQLISSAIGGQNLTETIEGRARFPINLRYPSSYRQSIVALKNMPIVSPSGAHITLGQISEIKISQGPPMIKTENARLNGWVFVDLEPGTDLVAYVDYAKKEIKNHLQFPTGISLVWTGQYEYWIRAKETLTKVIPATMVLIMVLLYFVFGRMREVIIIMGVIPFALVGSIWTLWFLNFQISVAVAVGLIALAGVTAEFGVIMLIYLKQAIDEAKIKNQLNTQKDLYDAIMIGAVQRVRPKAMTVAVILAGLLPIMFATGTGSEVMQRIAAPMVGGMISAPLVSMFLIPIIVWLLEKPKLTKESIK